MLTKKSWRKLDKQMRMVKKNLQESILCSLKLLKIVMFNMLNTGYPYNDNEVKFLKKLIDVYDTEIAWLEKHVISKYRSHLEMMEENKNEEEN